MPLPSILSLCNGYGTWSYTMMSETTSKNFGCFVNGEEVVRALRALMGFNCPEQPPLDPPAHVPVELRVWSVFCCGVPVPNLVSWVAGWVSWIDLRSGSLPCCICWVWDCGWSCHVNSAEVLQGLCLAVWDYPWGVAPLLWLSSKGDLPEKGSSRAGQRV